MYYLLIVSRLGLKASAKCLNCNCKPLLYTKAAAEKPFWWWDFCCDARMKEFTPLITLKIAGGIFWIFGTLILAASLIRQCVMTFRVVTLILLRTPSWTPSRTPGGPRSPLWAPLRESIRSCTVTGFLGCQQSWKWKVEMSWKGTTSWAASLFRSFYPPAVFTSPQDTLPSPVDVYRHSNLASHRKRKGTAHSVCPSSFVAATYATDSVSRDCRHIGVILTPRWC